MNWTEESLRERLGDRPVRAGPVDFTMEDFFKYQNTTKDESPLFVFDKLFSNRIPEMLQDYQPPEYFQNRDLFDLLGDQRPDFRWLLMGGARSGSKWHIDPNNTCAWNAVLKGSKRWLFLPP